MKYIILPALALALILSPATLAYAKEGADDVTEHATGDDRVKPLRPLLGIPPILKKVSSSTREDIKDLREDRHGSSTPEDRREDRKNIRADLKDDNGLHLGIAMRIHGEAIRFGILLEATIHRLENLIDRLTRRANELDAKGIATADGRAHLAIATTELTAAKTDLASIKTDAAANATLEASSTPQVVKEKWQHARDLMKSAREHVRKAFDEIKAALKAFRTSAAAHGEADAASDSN